MADQATDTSLIDLLKGMTADSIEASSLDVETLMLVRIAALVAVDAPVASYLLNLGAASELDIDPEQVRGVLAAVAPIVGTARIVSAATKSSQAIGVTIELAELAARGGHGGVTGWNGAVPVPVPGTGTAHGRATARGATMPDVDPTPEPANAAEPAPRRARSPRRPAAASRGTRSSSPAKPEAVPHFTPDERAARGKAERAKVPRSIHGEWAPAEKRRDPVDLLSEQAATRVPELVPIRYGRMLVSPFTFFRGAAYLMAADLAGVPRTGLNVQLCGDAHLSNFGVFASPDRRLVFGVNDFDETLPGPFEWDLKRLVASFAVAGRDRGFDGKQRGAINRAVTASYREAMQSFAGMDTLALWYARLDVDQIVELFRRQASKKQSRQMDREPRQGPLEDQPEGALEAHPRRRRGAADRQRPAVDRPGRGARAAGGSRSSIDDRLHELIRAYRRTLPGDRRVLLERFRYVHSARKVVGVGSVGTRAWIVLMLGRDDTDPLFLQAKQAEASVLEPFLGKSTFAHHGQRVVEGQQLTQAASDIMLGWVRANGVDGVDRDFYVRQLWDAKGSAVVETMTPEDDDAVRAGLRLGARQGPRPLRGRDRDRELPGRVRCDSTGRWPRSPRRTRTRTSATTPRCRRRWNPAASRPRRASEISHFG